VLRKLKKASQQQNMLGDDNQYEYQAYCVNRYDLCPEELVDYYRQRATSENYIKEIKSDTRFKYFTVQKFWSNEALFQIAMLFYNTSIWFRARFISKKTAKERLYTFRLKFITVPARFVNTGNQHFLRLNEEYRYRSIFEKTQHALS
jgi:hypothetical protein